MTATRVNPAHYTYRVTWSSEDAEYAAQCLELPSVSWLAVTKEDALAGLERIVREAVNDMNESGEQVPTPFADHHYSGKFNVRIPESLHRRLATEAAEQGVSLNRLVSNRLATD
ncbi:MAG: type II toxin-antitoxin system HicB family antitoxin [Mycobacteriales bacterium]